jgi:phosphatidylserine/phosphatidylglycerophosphate/cardiolipin synthase-like enzyme
MIGQRSIAMSLALFLAVGCIYPLMSSERPQNLPAAAELGAYRRGMNLRQTFDSLSATAHRVRIELLADNVDAWTARWRLLSSARESIDINYFIFSQDVFGLALLGHLVDKARQGVRVRLQIDAQGKRMSGRPYDIDCLPFVAGTENVSVRLHRSMPRRMLEALVRLEPTLATASDHDKVLVVDNGTGVVGGRNIEAKYFAHPEDMREAFHDVDVVLEGKGVSETLTEVFETTHEGDNTIPVAPVDPAEDARCAAALRVAYESMDAWLHGRPLGAGASASIDGGDTSWAAALARFPRLNGAMRRADRGERVDVETRTIDSVPRPGSATDAVTRSLARLFDAAESDVLMETPYMVLTEPAAAMLAGTGRRNVRMRLLTNSPRSTDNALSQLYFREQWPRLLAEVPRLRLFAAGTTHNIHSKFVVFDDQVVLLGSYNLDPFSMLVSGELMVAVWSKEFAERVALRPEAMIARGAPEVYEYTIERDADGDAVRVNGSPVIRFGPAQHTDASEAPLRGFRWALLRAVPWLAGLPPFF